MDLNPVATQDNPFDTWGFFARAGQPAGWLADRKASVVGTANMDIRSFDLNFEIMSVIYSAEFAQKMEDMFLDDLKECEEINPGEWAQRGLGKKLVESIARLVSAFL